MKKSVFTELEKGSRADPLMLFVGVATMILGFLTMYDMDFWEGRDDLWGPFAAAGSSIIVLNLLFRFARSKLTVNLLTDNGNKITIRLPTNIQFSGWVDDQCAKAEKSEIKAVKIFDFRGRTTAGPVGMFWVCFEFHSGRIIEGNIDGGDAEVIPEIIDFVRLRLPNVNLVLDEKIKI